MRGARHVFGLGIAAAPALSLFAAQTLLISQGKTEAVLGLAQFSGILGLLFFVFDGQSGLAPAMMRLRHDDATIRAAYRFYRLALLLAFLMALPVGFILLPDLQFLFVAILICLLLRLRPLDHDLDRRNWQHWGMLAQNGWMITLAAVVLVRGEIDPTVAGLSALFGTALYALVHGRTKGAPLEKSRRFADIRPALMDLLALMAAQGLGQIYGRAVLFALGALFSGPVAALAIYAKQVFNAAGILLLYLRRLELKTARPNMRLSLFGQAGIAVIGSVATVLAASRLDVAAPLILALLGWQVIEKLSATGVYALQLLGRHDVAFRSFGTVMVFGALGLALAAASNAVIGFVAFETLGYGAALLFWAASRQSTRLPGEVRAS
ncbi:hypothetical protein DevBK_17860 [Devosia sp. BK]|uniref:hypothetical protein n=1 Tax=Devosia sp. BK TaxID=2871706 RepID=UPI00293A2A44|nr:hypothetical protein [Devosia sp. BK]MDV3253208.1 hypothetical protein [Devosia sp. BK]